MKIRSGLVSNSSSSSFTCLVKKETYDKAIKEVHPYFKAVIETVSQKTKVFGLDAVCIETFDTPGGSMWEYTEIDYDGEIPNDKYGDKMYEGEALGFFLSLCPDEDYWITGQDW